MTAVNALRTIPVFQSLSATLLGQVEAASQREQYERGAVLFRQGERAEFIWIVMEGWVHLVRTPTPHNGSHAVVVFTVTPDEALCGISAIDASAYNLSAIAATDCHVIRIPSEVFNKALQREPAFASNVVRLCVRRLQHIAQQYGSMAEPVSHRIIRALLRLQAQFGSTLPVTHRELAQMAWTTTESAIRVVRRLKQQGHVTGRRGELRIGHSGALAWMLRDAKRSLAV